MAETVKDSDDLRVQRSRTLIQEAFFALVVEKGFAAVTVRDIAARAMVNRSTFYRHYLDKYDLLDQYLNQLQAQVSDAALRAESTHTALLAGVPAGLLVLVKHVQKHAPFYRVMLGKNGDQAFTYRFRQLSEQRYQYLFSHFNESRNSQEPSIELQLRYISYAFIGAMLWWLDNNQPSTAEQFAIWLCQLSMTTAGLSIQDVKQS